MFEAMSADSYSSSPLLSLLESELPEDGVALLVNKFNTIFELLAFAFPTTLTFCFFEAASSVLFELF
jgi:energy-converting hydrogenase Eha subunit E